MSTSTPQNDAKTVANRTIVQAAVLAFVVLMSIVAWLAFDFILLLFASILFGVLIHGVSRWLCSKTALSYKLSMAVFFVLLGQLISAAAIDHFGLFGAQVSPITLMRALGISVMAAGVWITQIAA